MNLNKAYCSDLFQISSLKNTANILHSVDLIVTSPPYMDIRDYGDEFNSNTGDVWEDWCLNVLEVLRQFMKESGVIWWNTGSHYGDGHKLTNVYSMVARAESELDLYLVDEIPWIKTSSPPKKFKNRPPAMWEHNYIFSKNPDLVEFNHDNVRRPYSSKTLERMKYPVAGLHGGKDGEFTGKKMITPNPKGALPYNWVQLPQDTTARPHPATMQPQLANWAIRAYSKEGELVMDPMCGAGTTLIEARRLGRNYIGFDLNQDYIDFANRSLEELDAGNDPYKWFKE